ncbi:mechanosensitive ion channel family protein [Acidiluteibacter ferrifornacis]|uniref:Mechanosensitive ion channel n=1 Tax=Acidiluteibacter ferrifornacis TaxID=2692424 RepID=A0A6N9NG65_9FLAO|nr:mechanosensitive ion channel domain-containing protein [Acidiluteibacter ferrifornacis]NBG64802.1 mechanosensitive ion channel [Acidiluteibacter ferrifornacis]
MEEIDVTKYQDQMVEMVITYGPKLILAILTLIIGLWVIKFFTKTVSNLLDKREIDASLKPFLKSLFSMVLKVLLVITVMGMVGIEMTSFIAILGAAGLAIGMALSGTLQNFSGGVILLIIKPFKVGDFIEAQGFSGTVTAIQIFNTILKTPNNQTIIIPNGGLSTGSVTNYSTESTRRLVQTYGIDYSDDVKQAREILLRIINEDSRVLKDPAPVVVLEGLGDSSVNLSLRAWTKNEDYWNVNFETTEKVKYAFDKEGVSFPFPQRDVHMIPANK